MLPLILISLFNAFAAAVTISPTTIGINSFPVTADSVKPSACAGIFLTNMVFGSGTFTGTAANDLILGSPGIDTIDGLGGDDCILGGGGDDDITGNTGTDICIGGPGTDTFTTCEGEIQ
ncbi:MAG: hypothetical protein QGD88_04485 [Anaerolineae bacterium]|nr:hypothetical protein [Anaerolineae bacterium]